MSDVEDQHPPPESLAAAAAAAAARHGLLGSTVDPEDQLPPSSSGSIGAAATSEAAIDEREVLFLIARYLEKREESRHAAATLITDLGRSGILGEAVGWDGRRKPATYADFKRRHRDLGPDHLVELLQGALAVDRTARASVAPVAGGGGDSLLLKHRGLGRSRQILGPAARRVMQKELIDLTMQLRRINRTEALVTRVVGKFDRLQQFLIDARVESLPADVRYALGTTPDATNLTALAADVRAVRQLLQVRADKARIAETLAALAAKARDAGALQSSMRTGENHVSILQRREIQMPRRGSRLPPMHIYSRMRRLKTLNGHLQIPTFCMTYDKRGRYVITGADDRLIKIWSLATGDLRYTLRGHMDNVTDLSVNHANTLLASSSDDKTVRVWELSTGAPVAVLLGHTGVVNSVRFHPTKNVVVTASDDGCCFCYKLPDIAKFDEPETKQQTAKRLLDQGAYLLTLRPMYSLSHVTTRAGVRSNKVLCLNFSRCGDYVVTGGFDGLGRVWDVSVLSSPELLVHTQQYQPAPLEFVAPVVPQQPEMRGTRPGAPVPTSDAPDPARMNTQQILQERGEQVESAGDTVTDGGGERRQQPQIPVLPSNLQLPPSDIGDLDIPALPNSDPIALLKGHTGPLTNIIFSHKGDMIATASIKDGTCRVWKWEKRYKKISHRILFHEERDQVSDRTSIYQLPQRRRAPPAVDTLVWTRGDERLITLHSIKPDNGSGEGDWRQRMRIWDPKTGNLEMTLAAVDQEKRNGHINAVFAMDAHPTDWRLVVTAGHDGRVFLWDISTGRILKSFENRSPEGETVPLLDGSFIPTGDGFCFTDRIGRLCVFGTGSGEQFAAAPVQQYFHSDYATLITDRNFHVIDREAQVAPSLMESGPLADVFLVQYPHQPPHLLASRGAWSPAHYEANRRRRVQQARESEVALRVHHTPQDENEDEDVAFPSAILKVPAYPAADRSSDDRVLAAGSIIAPNAFRLNNDPVFMAELRRRARQRQRHDNGSRRQASPNLDERDTSILNIEISSDDDHSDEDFQVAADTRDGDADDDEEDDEDDDDEMSEDEMLSDVSEVRQGRSRTRNRRSSNYSLTRPGGRRLGRASTANLTDVDDEGESVAIRSRRRRATNRVDDSEDDVEAVELADEDGQRSTRNRRRSASVETADSSDQVVVESNDGFIVGSNQLDKFDRSMEYESMLEAKRHQIGSSSASGDAEPLITCAFCGAGDDGGMLKLPGDAMGVHPLICGAQRLFVHDQCAIASPLCFKRGGKWYNVTKEIRRGRSITCVGCSQRGATVGCTIERCPKSYHWKCAVACGWSMNQIHFYCPQHADAPGSQATSTGATDSNLELPRRFGVHFHREWLQLANMKGMHQYVPQVGDYIVYFPDNHHQFLQHNALRIPSYLTRFSKYGSLKCRVIDVKYAFPPVADFGRSKVIRCEVKVAVLAVPAARRYDLIDVEEKSDDAVVELHPPSNLFDPESPYFSRYASVDEQLVLTNDTECERMTVELEYFSHDLSNFIVLDHVFEGGVCWGWQVGDRVMMPFVELNEHGLETGSKISVGTIDEIVMKQCPSDASTVIPWECIHIHWDSADDDDCYVSPWELEPAQRDIFLTKKQKEQQLASTRLHHSRTFSLDQISGVARALTSVMDLSIAKDFIDPVSEEFLDYMITVANPIDLTKIRQRVSNQYYRQLEGFISDVELLHLNCETYNVPTSPIAQNSRSITNSLFTRVQQLFPGRLDHELGGSNDSSNSQKFAYPPNDYGDNHDEVQITVPEFDFSESPLPDESLAEQALDPVQITEPNSESLPVPTDSQTTQGEAGPTSVRQLRRMNTRNAAEGALVLSDATESPNPSTPQRRSRRTRQEPESDVTPVRPTGTPRSAKSSRKRQRETSGPQILDFDGLVNMLTRDQRELFEAKTEEDLSSVLEDFHESLMGADVLEIFRYPVTEEIAPGYFDIIKKPMDFGTIMDSIGKFEHFFEYFDQVVLVFQNAITYNTWESEIGQVVLELQGCYIKFLCDAIGASLKSTQRPGKKPMRSQVEERQVTPTPASRNRKRRAISDEEDEQEADWDVSASESPEDEDDESDSESDELSDDDGIPVRRRPTRRAAARPPSKKAKKMAHRKRSHR